MSCSNLTKQESPSIKKDLHVQCYQEDILEFNARCWFVGCNKNIQEFFLDQSTFDDLQLINLL